MSVQIAEPGEFLGRRIVEIGLGIAMIGAAGKAEKSPDNE